MCASILWKLRAVFSVRFRVLVCALTAGALFASCRTPPVQEESFARAFDAQRVAQLSHEAAKVAFQASTKAGIDLRSGAFTPLQANEMGKIAPGQMNLSGHQPTTLDYETVAYLDAISRHVGWVARKVEKNPTSPRVSSKTAYDLVAHDVMMLRLRYQPASFRSSSVKIQYLLTLLDQIAPYYEQKQATQPLKALSGAKGS